MYRICDPSITDKHIKYYEYLRPYVSKHLEIDGALKAKEFIESDDLPNYFEKRIKLFEELNMNKIHILNNKFRKDFKNKTSTKSLPEGEYQVMHFHHPLWDVLSLYALPHSINRKNYFNNLGFPIDHQKYFTDNYLEKLLIPNEYSSLFENVKNGLLMNISTDLNGKLINNNIVINKKSISLNRYKREPTTPSFGRYDLKLVNFTNKSLADVDIDFQLAIFSSKGNIFKVELWGDLKHEFIKLPLLLNYWLGKPLEKEMFCFDINGIKLYPKLKEKRIWFKKKIMS